MLELADVILVVDDHMNMRRTIKNMLRKLGYTNVVEAENGDRARHILKTQKINLIIADWRMEGLSGLELLRAARKEEALKDIPFLMITAEGDEGRVALVGRDRGGCLYYKAVCRKNARGKDRGGHRTQEIAKFVRDPH